jgi:hypothetical protein
MSMPHSRVSTCEQKRPFRRIYHVRNQPSKLKEDVTSRRHPSQIAMTMLSMRWLNVVCMPDFSEDHSALEVSNVEVEISEP